MRQIVLDTETTGLSPKMQHRVTEIGCVELINRKATGRVFQTYLNPERELDEKAAEISGLSWSFLRDKPKFIEIADKLIDFIDGAELIIHNAPFDLGFLDYELELSAHIWGPVINNCSVIDTLVLAKNMFPGQRNNLDALCKRYNVDNSNRKYHGALLDSELLAEVYLRMTSGQTRLDLDSALNTMVDVKINMESNFFDLPVITATIEEEELHLEILRKL